MSAYFVPAATESELYECFRATDSTISVWSADMQHGAPPSALLARSIERCEPREGTRIGRITTEILGPVPVADIEVRAWVERPGSRVEMVCAELRAERADGSNRAVARATAWRIATSDSTSVVHDVDAPLQPGPDECQPGWSFASDWHGGYLDSLEIRGAAGPSQPHGAGRAWARPLVALVAGEEFTALTRLMSVADIANGVGARLPVSNWTFLNTELTVHLFREPVGEWIGVQSETAVGPDGIGMCAGVLHDSTGPVGRTLQILEIRARTPAQ